MSEFKLVPAKMLLDKETIEAINFHCGDGDGEDSQFGEYSDGLLWVGTVKDDDGKDVYGLHIATAEYPEEGSTTLVEFSAPEDAAQSELAALREELAEVTRQKHAADVALDAWPHIRDGLKLRLTAAEQRNAELVGLLEESLGSVYCEAGRVESSFAHRLATGLAERIEVALKPTESGASE